MSTVLLGLIAGVMAGAVVRLISKEQNREDKK